MVLEQELFQPFKKIVFSIKETTFLVTSTASTLEKLYKIEVNQS